MNPKDASKRELAENYVREYVAGPQDKPWLHLLEDTFLAGYDSRSEEVDVLRKALEEAKNRIENMDGFMVRPSIETLNIISEALAAEQEKPK